MNETNTVLGIFWYNFKNDNGALEVIKDNSRTLVLPETIDGEPLKILGKGIFYKKHIQHLILPAQLEVIGNSAFQDNYIKEVIIPPNTKHIGYFAFIDNPLERIVLPPSLIYIDEEAFGDSPNSPVLVCQEGSYAHKYAIDGHKAEVLSELEFNKIYESEFLSKKELCYV